VVSTAAAVVRHGFAVSAGYIWRQSTGKAAAMLRKLLLAAILLASWSVVHASEPIEVYIGDGCSCCGEWAKYMQKKGFMVRAHNVTSDQLARVKKEAGIAEKYASPSVNPSQCPKSTSHQPDVVCTSRFRNELTSRPRVGMTHTATMIHSTHVGIDRRKRYIGPPARRGSTIGAATAQTFACCILRML
jgi:hypothetical protein